MTEKNLTDKEKIDAILQQFHINLAEFSRKLDVKTDTIYSVFFEKTKGFSMKFYEKSQRPIRKFLHTGSLPAKDK